jgi:hypothetical protein
MLLSDFARTLAMRLPQKPCRCRDENVQAEHYTFSTENLPEIPALLVTSELVMRKTEHHYGSTAGSMRYIFTRPGRHIEN